MRKAMNTRQRRMTGFLRVLPNFLIIGGQKCGTTSLYSYLGQHPSVLRATPKEVHFFDERFHRGLNWYRAHFPMATSRLLINLRGDACLVGEASPYYMFHPLVPLRVHTLLPQARVIALLRNPVDRALSHYHHQVRKGRETLSFEEAVEQETCRLSGEVDRMIEDPRYRSFNHRHYSYLSRGLYLEQLQRWAQVFRRDQMLILRAEDLFVDPSSTFKQVCEWLQLRPIHLPEFKRRNQGQYAAMSQSTRRQLLAFFEPHNQRLYQHLGRDFGWNA